MINDTKLSSMCFSRLFGMLFLGLLLVTGISCIGATKGHAAELTQNNKNSSLFSAKSPKSSGEPLLNSFGYPISKYDDLYIRVIDETRPDANYYFENHYRGAYDWVLLANTTSKTYKYKVLGDELVEGTPYYVMDVNDNGYLKSYKPDLSYLKGGVYEGGKSGADKWTFNRKIIDGKVGYEMTSDRSGVNVTADINNTSSLVVNSSAGDKFIVIFELI
ncbi:hypothetical protein [Enterococcus gilvus]|uniref:hypothetical protein n=1 Tax=Enterococcus gilvus TaxID=160453 RepID=UPI0028D3283C|nr:hypothetical protein [Enterococcus gilvus]